MIDQGRREQACKLPKLGASLQPRGCSASRMCSALDRNHAQGFHTEAGAGGVSRAGWLELEQSNSASFENESLKTLTGAFCHRWRKSARGAAAAGGSGQGSIRSLRHLCWRFPQGPGSAGSREPQRAGNGQELGIAGGGQKFRGRRGREQPAAAWRRSRHAYLGVLTQ